MSVELRVPAVGESITEVQIARWLKKAGEHTRADEPVAVLETDKVTVELPAPVAGSIGRLLKAEGQKAAVGEVIAYIEENGTGGDGAAAPAVRAEPSPPKAGARDPAPVMPAARRLASEHGIDTSEIAGSGRGGRVTKEDVQRRIESPSPAAPAAPAPVASVPAQPAPIAPSPAAPAPIPSVRPSAPSAPAASPGGAEEELVPLTPLRLRIAERLLEAQRTTAMLTTFNEIDLAAVAALRADRGPGFLEKHGVKLGLMSFFVKAAVDALRLVPQVNAEMRGDALLFRHYCDIGVAVGGGKGLVVPVLRRAERMSFAEIEKTIADFAARAKENKLRLEELTGGTFTISNGGVYGSLMSTPILNPPQSGILGLHAMQDRPVARGGQVVIRPMMYVALSYDHRVVDGREAVTFLKRVKECVEEPSRMLLED